MPPLVSYSAVQSEAGSGESRQETNSDAPLPTDMADSAAQKDVARGDPVEETESDAPPETFLIMSDSNEDPQNESEAPLTIPMIDPTVQKDAASGESVRATSSDSVVPNEVTSGESVLETTSNTPPENPSDSTVLASGKSVQPPKKPLLLPGIVPHLFPSKKHTRRRRIPTSPLAGECNVLQEVLRERPPLTDVEAVQQAVILGDSLDSLLVKIADIRAGIDRVKSKVSSPNFGKSIVKTQLPTANALLSSDTTSELSDTRSQLSASERKLLSEASSMRSTLLTVQSMLNSVSPMVQESIQTKASTKELTQSTAAALLAVRTVLNVVLPIVNKTLERKE
ncbi:hypothetical protein K438DRAFT_1818991 [Mycena galopus ATCC 62051]|nr:hypothetical protein K438DRAFT_1818991 [Mycena galopus ATCC 62051]